MNASSTQDRYRAIIEGIGQIPTLPTVVAKAMEILNNPSSSADSASRLLSQDPALSSKVLRLANSAFYGIPRTISSINSAVVILGFATIKSLVVSASVLKMFSGSAAVKGFDRRAFWRHSVSAAMATRMLARRYAKIASVDVEAAFMAGLLHKVGIMVLDTVMQKELEQCLAAALQSGRSLPELEVERLGIHHAQLGGLLAEKWGLPDELRYPIMEHIEPQNSTIYPEIAMLVHLGSHLCESIGVTAFGEVRQWPLHASALGLVKLTEDDLPQLQEDLRQDLEMAQGFFGLIDSAN